MAFDWLAIVWLILRFFIIAIFLYMGIRDIIKGTATFFGRKLQNTPARLVGCLYILVGIALWPVLFR